MTLSQCPAAMRAARPSFAQGSAWQIILLCGIKLGIIQRVSSLLFSRAFVRLADGIPIYCKKASLYTNNFS
jgi:hypothetical protein